MYATATSITLLVRLPSHVFPIMTFAARNFAMASAPPAPVSIAPPVPHAGPSLLNARWDTFNVEALPGRLGVRFDTGTSHRVMGVSASSPLAGRVTVGDELVRIKSLAVPSSSHAETK